MPAHAGFILDFPGLAPGSWIMIFPSRTHVLSWWSEESFKSRWWTALFPVEIVIFHETMLCFGDENCVYFSVQLAAGPEGNQLYDHVTPAQQKNAAIVNSLFQLHQAVIKVTVQWVSHLISRERWSCSNLKLYNFGRQGNKRKTTFSLVIIMYNIVELQHSVFSMCFCLRWLLTNFNICSLAFHRELIWCCY